VARSDRLVAVLARVVAKNLPDDEEDRRHLAAVLDAVSEEDMPSVEEAGDAAIARLESIHALIQLLTEFLDTEEILKPGLRALLHRYTSVSDERHELLTDTDLHTICWRALHTDDVDFQRDAVTILQHYLVSLTEPVAEFDLTLDPTLMDFAASLPECLVRVVKSSKRRQKRLPPGPKGEIEQSNIMHLQLAARILQLTLSSRLFGAHSSMTTEISESDEPLLERLKSVELEPTLLLDVSMSMSPPLMGSPGA